MKIHNYLTNPNQDDAIYIQKLIKSLPNDMKIEQGHYEKQLLRESDGGSKVTWSDLSKGVIGAYKDIAKEWGERPKNNRYRDQPDSENFANTPKCWECGSVYHKANQRPKRTNRSSSRFYQATRGRGGGQGGRGWRVQHTGKSRGQYGQSGNSREQSCSEQNNNQNLVGTNRQNVTRQNSDE